MAVTNSLKISLISAGIGILIAFLGARAAMNVGSRFRRVFMTILNMVSNFAGIPLAFAYMILLGNAGIVVQLGRTMGWDALANYNLYTSNGLAMVYVYFQIPLSTLLLIPAFQRDPERMEGGIHAFGCGQQHVLAEGRNSSPDAKYSGHVQHSVRQRPGCLRNGLRHHDEQYLAASHPDRRMFRRRGENPEGTGRRLIRNHDGNHGHYDSSDQHNQQAIPERSEKGMKKHRAGSGIIPLLILVWLLIPLIVTIIYSLFQNWTGNYSERVFPESLCGDFQRPRFSGRPGPDRPDLHHSDSDHDSAGSAGAFCDRAVFPRSGTGCADHLHDSVHDSGRHSLGQHPVYVRGK
jgi:hypothetical protein